MNIFLKETSKAFMQLLGVLESFMDGPSVTSTYDDIKNGKWSVITAKTHLLNNDGINIEKKTIWLPKYGFSGLKSCSAVDFLKRNGYYAR